MNTTSKYERFSAAIAAVAVTFLMVWAIADYALSGDDGVSLAGPIAKGFPPLAFVAN